MAANFIERWVRTYTASHLLIFGPESPQGFGESSDVAVPGTENCSASTSSSLVTWIRTNGLSSTAICMRVVCGFRRLHRDVDSQRHRSSNRERRALHLYRHVARAQRRRRLTLPSENQFFIGALADPTEVFNQVADAILRRVLIAIEKRQAFRVIILIPVHPDGR